MAVFLKHAFSSAKADGPDATLVQPSNWNSEHVLAIDSPRLLGRTSGIGATTSSLSGVTQANPGVFTTTGAHNLVVGQLITITGVVGMTQLNGNTYVVNTTPLSTTFTVTFQGTALNTTSYTAYSSGGTVTPTGTGVVEEITVTGTGSAVLSTTASIINPTVTNYTETSYTITTGATATIDIANGTVQRFTLSQNVIFSILTGAAGKSFILILTQDSSPRTVTWPVNVTWPSGTPPTISTGSGKRDIYSFFFDATTSAWLGATIGQNY